MSIYRRFLPYGVAIGSVVIALILSLWFTSLIDRPTGAFFYIAVAISTWYGGKKPGGITIVLSTLAIIYFLLPPIQGIQVYTFQNFLWLLLFVIVSLIINLLSANLQENKQKVEQLSYQITEESASRLRTALNAAQMGMWDWNLVTGEIKWSPEHEQLFGLPPGAFDGKYETFDARLHPDDRQGLNQAVTHALKNQVPYQHEYRVVWTDGSIHWVEGRGQGFYNQAGQPVRMSGTIMAIDVQKQTEQMLYQREAILRLFAQYAPAGIAMFDQDMHYVMTSQRWADDYDLGSFKSLIGRSHYDVFPEIPERWKQIHQRCLAGAVNKCDEDLFVRADGTQQWIRWEVRPWHTATNEIGGIIIFSEDITQRKHAESSVLQLNQELQQKVTELETLLDVIPIGIGIAEDPAGQRIRVNPAFAQTLNIPPTVNASLSALEEHPTAFKVYQNGREMTPEELPLQYAAIHGIEVRDLEVDVVWQDGTRVTLLEYAAPLFDEHGQTRGSVGAFLNISERKQSEAALQESEKRYRILVQNFPNGAVCLFDHDLRYLLAGGQGLATIGLDRALLEGKTIWEVFDPETCRMLEPDYRSALAGHSHIAEIAYAGRIYRTHLLPLYDDRGLVQLGISMTQDITLQKQAEQILRTSRDELEQQVQERTRELRQLTEELQHSNQELEQFAYVASHDLQEPLRAITSFTQMLAKRYQRQLDAKADMYIEFIVDGATRMQQLIRDLLAYSRAGRYELKLQPVDCNALLERVKKDLQVAINENQAVITTDPLPTITADPSQMVNLLQNLIGNSLKYRSAAAPQIHISAETATVDADNPVSQDRSLNSASPVEVWLFSIRDNGIGIDPQYAERIFTIFQRLHTSDEYSGTGLGLAICRKIIERHEGRIWVESQIGQGATFFFTIPISSRTQDDIPNQITQNSIS